MPRRNGNALPSDAEAAREHLMDAAEVCFDKCGIRKTTMDDIAEEAGVSRPTVYRHFSDRDTLFLAVVIRRSRQLIEADPHRGPGTGEVRADLDLRAIATWFTYLILLLVGRGDLEPDVNGQREMLRTFVLPAFAPVPAAPVRAGRAKRA